MKGRKTIFILFILLSLLENSNAQTNRKSYFVKKNGSDSATGLSVESAFSSLQKAVEMASRGSIKRITIVGEIKSQGQLEIVGSEILITGKNENGEDLKAVISNGIRINNSWSNKNASMKLRLENIEISGSTTSGLSLFGRNITVTLGDGVVICNNSTNEYGGGCIVNSGSLLIVEENSIIRNNRARNGGGIAVAGYGKVIMNGGIIKDNIAVEKGGGVFVYNGLDGGGFFELKNGQVISNLAEDGGGVFNESTLWKVDHTFLMTNGLVKNNKATNNGGGIFGNFKLSGGEISSNYATLGGGLFSTSKNYLKNVAISNNNANYGGGIYVFNTGNPSYGYKSDLIIDANVKVIKNIAKNIGGGIYVGSGANCLISDEFIKFEKDLLSGNISKDDEETNDIFIQ